MQLGIGSYTYGWNVAEQAMKYGMNEHDLIDKARLFDVQILQIGDNLPMHEWSEERLNRFDKALKENNIKLEIGARGLTPSHLNRYIELCVRFEVKLLRFIVDEKNHEPSNSEIVQVIKEHLSLLEKNNIQLGLENHDRLKATEYEAIIKQVKSKLVGICLDTVNSMGKGESVEHIIEILAPYTINLHIKDFGIARLPHLQGFIIDGRVAGEGMLNVASIVENLKPYKRCHTCILEQWVPPENDKVATIQKEQQWAEKSMNYLKKLQVWNDKI
jgi:3-oxoisoapionate decarboxylase